jgi:hypothetical protein
LVATTTYNWSVKASCSGFAANASFTTTGTTSCTAPTSLTTTNITQTSATLNWAAVSGATGYTVQYKTAAATTWTSLNTTANSLVLSGLIAGTSYNWLVKASCSSNSVTASFTTANISTPPPASTCAVVTNLLEKNITSTTALLLWTGNVNAQSYTVRFREVGAATWTYYPSQTTASRNVKLKPRRSYEWAVDTKCTNGITSGATAVKRFTSL